jgi:hypothetical protein
MCGGLRYEEDEVTGCGTSLPHWQMWGEIGSLTRASDYDLTVPPLDSVAARHLGPMLARWQCRPLLWHEAHPRLDVRVQEKSGTGATGGLSRAKPLTSFIQARASSPYKILCESAPTQCRHNFGVTTHVHCRRRKSRVCAQLERL